MKSKPSPRKLAKQITEIKSKTPKNMSEALSSTYKSKQGTYGAMTKSIKEKTSIKNQINMLKPKKVIEKFVKDNPEPTVKIKKLINKK